MRVLVLNEDYPTPKNHYSDVFAHMRVKNYGDAFDELLVLRGFSSDRSRDEYVHEGVRVLSPASIEEANIFVQDFKPDVVLIHFALKHIVEGIMDLNQDLNYVVWVHGIEALSYKRRLFNYNLKSLKSLYLLRRYRKSNLAQLKSFKKIVDRSNATGKIRFVFVSEWMRDIASTDCQADPKNYRIIANPIDDSFFNYQEKKEGDFYKMLMIRPFNSKKYATDLVTKLIATLSEKPYFEKMSFSIFGKGAEESTLNKQFGHLKQVDINDRFLDHETIRSLHHSHGIGLFITRQDAQGVSMCEAMSSGMLILSSNNTAIPEFVQDGETGLLCDNTVEDMVRKVESIIKDQEASIKIAHKGAKSIRQKAGLKNVIRQELDYIQSF